VADHEDVRRLHGYHPMRVRRVVQETADTRSYELDVPGDADDLFGYRAGQFCAFRVHVAGEELIRCYSMSSAPETDEHLTVTVKRVPGGAVSTWLLDNVTEGDVLEATKPSGVFTVPEGDAPVVALCGGSGVTPVMSITKSVLASTDRTVRILYANRDADSVIFRDELDRLVREHPDRLEVRHHLDSEGGYLTADDIGGFAAGAGEQALHFLCGPTPFMDLVEQTLLEQGVPRERILLERFGDQPGPSVGEPFPGPEAGALADDTADDITVGGTAVGGTADGTETVTIVLKGSRTDVAYHPGDTILQTARAGGLQPPFSCEAGNCATCMAQLHDGSATMRTNNALTPEEVDEGWVLTCQALPQGRQVTVEYESF
jgi:3-ketosteroid 9alpha-monooxygenase subunit B